MSRPLTTKFRWCLPFGLGLALAAAGLYVYALLDARITACPTQLDGIELVGQRVSIWPPGAMCRSSVSGNEMGVHQFHPWMTSAVACLAIAAACLLTLGITALLLSKRTPTTVQSST